MNGGGSKEARIDDLLGLDGCGGAGHLGAALLRGFLDGELKGIVCKLVLLNLQFLLGNGHDGLVRGLKGGGGCAMNGFDAMGDATDGGNGGEGRTEIARGGSIVSVESLTDLLIEGGIVERFLASE